MNDKLIRDNMKIRLDLDRYTMNKVLEVIDNHVTELIREYNEIENTGSANQSNILKTKILYSMELFDKIVDLAINQE